MKYDEKYKNINIFVVNSSYIQGDGWLEEQSVINGRLNSRFYIGAYTVIDIGCYCTNTFIGRFSFIDKNVHIGYQKLHNQNFSMHPFSNDLPFIASDNYYKKIKTSRFYYEQNKYTFIGNDVFIGKNSIIEEGCVIGDGVIIHPNTYLNFNVEDYAIVSGNPAKIIGFRYDTATIVKLKNLKWWRKDISSKIYQNKPNTIDYVNNLDLIDKLYDSANNLPPLTKKTYHINTVFNSILINEATKLITGPSHIDLWYRKYLKGEVTKPRNYHLLPIPALSLFSDQLEKLIVWWKEWFGEILLFVPDFRIGNVAVDNPIKDGRFIRQDLVSIENSLKCYSLGIEKLDIYTKNHNISLWFWCLFGREEFNKNSGNYNEEGHYKHPVWNYNEILERYSEHTVDIKKHFPNILECIVDGSIHPTNDTYEKMSKLFDEL